MNAGRHRVPSRAVAWRCVTLYGSVVHAYADPWHAGCEHHGTANAVPIGAGGSRYPACYRQRYNRRNPMVGPHLRHVHGRLLGFYTWGHPLSQMGPDFCRDPLRAALAYTRPIQTPEDRPHGVSEAEWVRGPAMTTQMAVRVTSGP